MYIGGVEEKRGTSSIPSISNNLIVDGQTHPIRGLVSSFHCFDIVGCTLDRMWELMDHLWKQARFKDIEEEAEMALLDFENNGTGGSAVEPTNDGWC
jgi:hypothetical protein